MYRPAVSIGTDTPLSNGKSFIAGASEAIAQGTAGADLASQLTAGEIADLTDQLVAAGMVTAPPRATNVTITPVLNTSTVPDQNTPLGGTPTWS